MSVDQASDHGVQALRDSDTGLRLEGFEALHGLSHPGRKPSVKFGFPEVCVAGA